MRSLIKLAGVTLGKRYTPPGWWLISLNCWLVRRATRRAEKEAREKKKRAKDTMVRGGEEGGDIMEGGEEGDDIMKRWGRG